MLTIRMATNADLKLIAGGMRAARDFDSARGAVSTVAAMKANLRSPDPCLVALAGDGSLVAIFGTAPHPDRDGNGAIWLFHVEPVRLCPVLLRTEAERHLRLFHQKYPTISSYTDRNNTAFQSWLRELGFTFRRAVTDGSNPILEYVRTRQCATH